MPTNVLFIDESRQEEIETFYKACQMHRDYYRGYPNAHHPLNYFREGRYIWQCAPEMTPTYLSYPSYHVKYKSPALLPVTLARTSGIPALPTRILAGRFDKAADKKFVR